MFDDKKEVTEGGKEAVRQAAPFATFRLEPSKSPPEEEVARRCCELLNQPVSIAATFFAYNGKVAFMSRVGGAAREELDPTTFNIALDQAEKEGPHRRELIPIRALQLLGHAVNIGDRINILANNTFPNDKFFSYLMRHLSLDVPKFKLKSQELEMLKQAILPILQTPKAWDDLQIEIDKTNIIIDGLLSSQEKNAAIREFLDKAETLLRMRPPEDQTRNHIPSLGSIPDRIKEYLNSRKPYYRNTYPDSVDVMLASEARILNEANARGDLADWQFGTDPLQHISVVIRRRFQQTDGSFRTSLDVTNFSSELAQLFKLAEKPNSGITCVWMNDSGTLTCPHDSTEKHEILSPGQGGCTQVVLASKDAQDTRISLLHYGPTQKAKLLEVLETRILVHQSRDADALIIVNPKDDPILIELVIKRLLPGARVRVEKLDLKLKSQDHDRDVLRCQPQNDGTVLVRIKGRSGVLLAENDPTLT